MTLLFEETSTDTNLGYSFVALSPHTSSLSVTVLNVTACRCNLQKQHNGEAQLRADETFNLYHFVDPESGNILSKSLMMDK